MHTVCLHVVLLDDVINWQETRVQIKHIRYDVSRLRGQSQSDSGVVSSYQTTGVNQLQQAGTSSQAAGGGLELSSLLFASITHKEKQRERKHPRATEKETVKHAHKT